jgi:LPXTG-motif cell wall-anchored protein
MDFTGQNPALFAVIGVTILVLIIYALISRRRRKMQERDMGDSYYYSSPSKAKENNKEVTEKSPYKFSPETGELLNTGGTDTENSPAFSEQKEIKIIEEHIRKADLTESQKQMALEEIKKHMSVPKKNLEILDENVRTIQNSSLSDRQKKKLI